MVKLGTLSVAGAALIAGLTLAPHGGAQAQEVLRFNNWLPPTHNQQVNVLQPWADMVEEATDGRVVVEFTASSLGAPPRQYDLAVDGIADVTFGIHGYTPGGFVLSGIVERPFLSDSAEALSVAYWRVYEEYLAEAGEHDDVVVLAVYTHGPGTIQTLDTPVDSIDDLEGMKMRVGGGVIQDISDHLGAVSIAAPATEVHDILSQGVADGAYFPSESYKVYRLDGIVNHQTVVPGGLYNTSFFIVMNRDAFDRLSSEDQEALMSVSGENLARMAGASWDAADAEAIAQMEEHGVNRMEADGDFLAALESELSYLDAEWIERANELGVDGEAALAALRSYAAEYEN
jgi:TRAP-type C4-dicarboxylate transport system substrate-binding protein